MTCCPPPAASAPERRRDCHCADTPLSVTIEKPTAGRGGVQDAFNGHASLDTITHGSSGRAAPGFKTCSVGATGTFVGHGVRGFCTAGGRCSRRG